MDQGALAQAINAARVAAAGSGDPAAAHDLGILLLRQYQHDGTAAAVAEAVAVLSGAVSAGVPGSAECDRALGALGVALRDQYEVTGDATVLDRAIELLSAVVDRGASPMTADHRINLAAALDDRIREAGDPADAEAAVALLRAALAESGPDEDHHLTVQLNLGNALLSAYELADVAEHLAEAVTLLREAAAASGEDDLRSASVVASLGQALLLAFEESGDIARLTESVDAGRRSVSLTWASDPGRSGYHLNLANSLTALFDATGDLALLDEAVRSARRAVAACPARRAQRGLPLSGLGNCLRTRYEATGELSALDEAIAADRAALAAASSRDPSRVSYLQNLAISLMLRHEHTADLALLRTALGHARAAAALASEDDPDRYLCQLTLGRAEYILFHATGDRDALERAIEAERAARRQIGDDHPGLAVCLANLAASLIVHYRSCARVPELEEAITSLAQAVAMTPGDSPDRALYLYNLGEAMITRSAGRPGRHAAGAVAAYQGAAATETAPPVLRAEAAMEWGRLSAGHGDWESAVAGFSAAIAQFPLISPRHFDRGDQEHQLAAFAGLASDAAACVLASGRSDPLRAAMLLEQGRGILLGHLLGASAELTRVQSADPALATEFEQARDALDASGPDRAAGHPVIPLSGLAGLAGGSDLTAGRRELVRRLDAVVEQIRALPGLADFLRPPAADQLLAAGSAGPVVMINVSQYRCDAIIIADGTARLLPLAGVTPEGVSELVGRYLWLFGELRQRDVRSDAQRARASADLRDICCWLWDKVARPVLDYLGMPPREHGWPRIWWCPTGALGLLPLHAAHSRDPGGVPTGVADRAVPSYTATVRALISLRDRARPRPEGARPLVVALASTPGRPALPHAEREIAALAVAGPLVLRDRAATCGAVSTALGQHSWFHFAGHSYQDLLRPGQASICLHDGDLTALSIASLRIVGGELAYLSSCESAVVGPQVPDEPLHLALAFQVAGYRNVIGTMWPVGDLVSARAARAVYRQIASRGRIDGDQAARALHRAVLELRARYPPEAWAAYLHAGA